MTRLWPMIRGVFGELQVVCLGCTSFGVVIVVPSHVYVISYYILQSPCESYTYIYIYIRTHFCWWHVHVLAKTPMSLYYILMSSLNTCGWFSLQFSWSAFSFFGQYSMFLAEILGFVDSISRFILLAWLHLHVCRLKHPSELNLTCLNMSSCVPLPCSFLFLILNCRSILRYCRLIHHCWFNLTVHSVNHHVLWCIPMLPS